MRRRLDDAGRWATAGLRAQPDFLVIGAQRAGTTSLYAYLGAHPEVVPASRKEVHHFDAARLRSDEWYRSHFPLRAALRTGRVTGEATPYLLYHPLAPARVAAALPEVRLVALLRDPVERAYSHYWHERRRGFEDLSFDEAVEREAARLGDDEDRLARGEITESHAHGHFSYAARGRYAEQLERWYEHVAPERLLIVASERLYADPHAVVAEVATWLGLPPPPSPRGPHVVHNEAANPPMSASARARLRAHFEPHDRRLYELLGNDLGWVPAART